MHQPPHFREDDLNVQHALIRAHPLGGQREKPWSVGDAPEEFIRAQLKGIIGVEMAEIEGKWKVSQNRPVADREGIAKGLDKMAEQAEMQELVRRYGGLGTE